MYESTLWGRGLAMGIPLQKPYPYSLYSFVSSSILGTWNVWLKLYATVKVEG